MVSFSLFDDVKLLLLTIVLVSRIKHIVTRFWYLQIIIDFIGTVLHELAHYVVAKCLLAKPSAFNILPKRKIYEMNGRTKEERVLGNIECLHLTWRNKFPIAFAPLLLLVVAYYINELFFFYANIDNLGHQLLYIFLLVIIADNAIPSFVDFRVGFSNIFGVFLWAGIFAGIFLHGMEMVHFLVTRDVSLNYISTKFFPYP